MTCRKLCSNIDDCLEQGAAHCIQHEQHDGRRGEDGARLDHREHGCGVVGRSCARACDPGLADGRRALDVQQATGYAQGCTDIDDHHIGPGKDKEGRELREVTIPRSYRCLRETKAQVGQFKQYLADGVTRQTGAGCTTEPTGRTTMYHLLPQTTYSLQIRTKSCSESF